MNDYLNNKWLDLKANTIKTEENICSKCNYKYFYILMLIILKINQFMSIDKFLRFKE